MKKKKTDNIPDHLAEEAEAFNRQAIERLTHGFVPDLRNLRKVPYFYNSPWREPEFAHLEIMPRVMFILRVVKGRKGRVIELGCGSGFLSLELARVGCHVTGVDVSPKSIAIAREFARRAKKERGFGSLEYIVGDIESIDLPPNTYDSVIFFSSLHHIARPEKILKRVERSLKRGGNLLVSEPVRENFTMRSALCAGLIRLAAPTWEPFSKKLKGIDTEKGIQTYIQSIFDEYTYRYEHQSPHDNATASEKVMLSAVKRFFRIQKIEHGSAFTDKLIGGLRGPERYALARALKAADDYAVKHELFPAMSVRIWAVKR